MKNKETVQLGLRIDKKLLEEIENLAEAEKIDKMSWIRRAINLHFFEVKDKIKEQWIKSYLNLSLDEEDFKKLMNLKKIPPDLEKVRKEKLNQLKK